MNNIDLHYFLHGLIILMIGLIAGYPFAKAIKNKNGKEVAWRIVHSGSSAAGIMLIAIGGVITKLALSNTYNSIIFFGIAGGTYILIIGMILAAVSGERGIGNSKEKHSSSWKIVYYSYALGALLSVLSIGALIYACTNKLME